MFNIIIKTPNIYPSIILPFAISLLISNNNSDKNANIKNIISKQINTFLYEMNFRDGAGHRHRGGRRHRGGGKHRAHHKQRRPILSILVANFPSIM